jgi:protein tyrosine/serine phosphatase
MGMEGKICMIDMWHAGEYVGCAYENIWCRFLHRLSIMHRRSKSVKKLKSAFNATHEYLLARLRYDSFGCGRGLMTNSLAVNPSSHYRRRDEVDTRSSLRVRLEVKEI